MGLLIRNMNKRVVSNIGGVSRVTMETAAGIQDAKILSITPGDPAGSRDGSQYCMLSVQINPGLRIRLFVAGEEKLAKVKDLKEGDLIEAYLTPLGTTTLSGDFIPAGERSSGFVLDDLLKVTPAKPVPAAIVDPAPAAQQHEQHDQAAE